MPRLGKPGRHHRLAFARSHGVHPSSRLAVRKAREELVHRPDITVGMLANPLLRVLGA